MSLYCDCTTWTEPEGYPGIVFWPESLFLRRWITFRSKPFRSAAA